MAGKGTISITFKLDGDGKGFKAIAQDADGLRTVMASTLQQSEKLKASLLNWSAAVNGLQAASNAVSQLNGTMRAITADSADFSKAMKAANTMAGKDAEGFSKLKSEVSELSKAIPVARDELANGLYQVISNGVPEDNWISFLEASARSSVGGIADLGQAVGVTSTIIKNYGLEWSAAQEVQDKIQLTAKNGVTSFEQLAQALPRVAGNAATLGVSIDELMASFATLTGVSGNTAEVSTQLAAIFTALVKPSSEATKMAEQMGIQFDAAAIKAAGGFQNFIQQLDSSIKSYAAANGVLEQEVYAKLFSSAESLRALIPLTGELSTKFTENVGAMVDSAGTMDEAFAQMSSTGEATTQMLKNQWAAVTDLIAGVTSAAQPYINFASGLMTTASSAAILITTFKQLNIVAVTTAAKTKLVSMAMVTLGLRSKSAAAVVRVLSATLKTGAHSATAMKIALRGLMIATGIGVAITVVTTIIEHFCNSVDAAADSVEKLDDCTNDYTQAAASAKVQIEKDIKALGDLIKAKKDTTNAVQHLNETYGEIFGTYKTAQEWYKILTDKSQLYIKQIGYEAQARALAAEIAEQSIKKEMAAEKMKQLEASGNARRTVSRVIGGGNAGYAQTVTYETKTPEYRAAEKERDAAVKAEAQIQARLDTVAKLTGQVTEQMKAGMGGAIEQVKVSAMTWQQCADAIEKNDKVLKNTIDPAKIKALKAQNAQLIARKKALEAQTGIGTHNRGTDKKKTIVADPKTLDEYKTNIELTTKKLTDADTEEQRVMREKIARWKEAVEVIEAAQAAAERPANLQSLEDYDKEIAYQQALRKRATAENIAGIDTTIRRLQNERAAFERNAHVATSVDKIETYEQLNAELAQYTDRLQTATAAERIEIQEQINALEDLKKAWDTALSDVKAPGDIGLINTIEDLDKAISFYDNKIKTATADEIAGLQRTKMAFEAKREAYQRGIQLPQMQKEVADIEKLTDQEYKVKIKGMGFEALTEKINELQRMLDDVNHPVTEAQRKDIESLIQTYEKWRKETIDSFDIFRSGRDGIKGVSGGIESITGALEGNGNAWQKVTAIIDGFLQIYDGIKTIVDIINMLSVATTAHTTAKTAEAVAVGASTGAQAAEAAAAEVTAAAQVPVIAANKLATASYMELAAAAYFAAHAYIPFTGFGIASGFVGAATAMVQGIGVMPFANGGIVSGPTLGLIGEYPGASNNPEVVAPLNRLRDLLQPNDGVGGGTVKFKIDGRTLVGVLEKETNVKHRS